MRENNQSKRTARGKEQKTKSLSKLKASPAEKEPGIITEIRRKRG